MRLVIGRLHSGILHRPAGWTDLHDTLSRHRELLLLLLLHSYCYFVMRVSWIWREMTSLLLHFLCTFSLSLQR